MKKDVGLGIPSDFKLEDWLPQEPSKGPPLPMFLKIYWPWYKEEVPTVYTCPYCGATFSTQEELNAHIAAAHPMPAGLTLFGTITDAKTGYPLQAAEITLFNSLWMIDREAGFHGTIYTNSNGLYSVAIPPGEYVGIVYKAGYYPQYLCGGDAGAPSYAWIFEMFTSDTKRDIALMPR